MSLTPYFTLFHEPFPLLPLRGVAGEGPHSHPHGGTQRGNERAARLIEKHGDKYLSIQSYMELHQRAKNKTHHKYVKYFICDFEFSILPTTKNIGNRALI